MVGVPAGAGAWACSAEGTGATAVPSSRATTARRRGRKDICGSGESAWREGNREDGLLLDSTMGCPGLHRGGGAARSRLERQLTEAPVVDAWRESAQSAALLMSAAGQPHY